MIDNNDIKALLQVGERITFECKKAEDSIPKSVWETYSSFANTIGGTILLGITENLKEINFDKRFYITGVKNPKKMKKDFFDTLNSNKVNRNILTDEDVDEVIYAGGHSKARNPNMQAMLRMIGFGDNIGSGFPTILSAWKKENWRKPILIEKTDLHLVELTLSMESFITEECSNNLKKLFGNSYINLQKEEQLILATAIMEDSVSNYYIQLLLDKNPLEAGKLLYSLVYRDLLISTNKGRWTTYTINYDYIQGVESRSKSQGVKSRDRKKKELINKIILYCQEPRTLQEIATYMGYSDRYRMKKEYINPLLGNFLQMTLSESKTAPTQQYIAIH